MNQQLSQTTTRDPELADLDLLDDTHRHAGCASDPAPKMGEPFTAICGRRAIWWTDLDTNKAPPDACPTCLTTPRCVPCGAVIL